MAKWHPAFQASYRMPSSSRLHTTNIAELLAQAADVVLTCPSICVLCTLPQSRCHSRRKCITVCAGPKISRVKQDAVQACTRMHTPTQQQHLLVGSGGKNHALLVVLMHCGCSLRMRQRTAVGKQTKHDGTCTAHLQIRLLKQHIPILTGYMCYNSEAEQQKRHNSPGRVKRPPPVALVAEGVGLLAVYVAALAPGNAGQAKAMPGASAATHGRMRMIHGQAVHSLQQSRTVHRALVRLPGQLNFKSQRIGRSRSHLRWAAA